MRVCDLLLAYTYIYGNGLFRVENLYVLQLLNLQYLVILIGIDLRCADLGRHSQTTAATTTAKLHIFLDDVRTVKWFIVAQSINRIKMQITKEPSAKGNDF